MMMLVEYLKSKGSIFKPAGSEQKTRCIFCDDRKDHLYVNDDKGVFHCHKCGESGNIWKLKRHYGELAIVEPEKKPYKKPARGTDDRYVLQDTGREYLKRIRGLTDETIRHFKLGQYKDFIAIPFYKNGELANFKFRKIDEKKFQRFTGAESVLFNRDKVDRRQDIIVTEGELDAISCWQLGEKNVIAVPIGANAFNPDWIDFFDSCSGDFYIAYDNDKAGEEGAVKVAEKIGRDRCRRVKLPLKDMNDCLMGGYSGTDLKDWLVSAVEYKPQHFTHISEIYQRLDDLYTRQDRGSGFKLKGWDDLNERLGGLRESEITVLTGDTSSGKSTFALRVFYTLLTQERRVLIASTEMQTEQVISILFSMHRNKNFRNFTDEDYQACLLWFAEKGVYFVDIHGRLSIGQIEDYIDYGKRKYDIGYVLLDHLHFFIRKTGSDNPVTDIENFVFDTVAIAKKTNVNIWLIAHPSKLDNTKGIVHMNDIKGSSAIKQDADCVITLWRDRDKEEDGLNEVVVNAEKVRHTSGTGGRKRYIFNPEGLSYAEKTDLRGTFGDGQPETSERAY